MKRLALLLLMMSAPLASYAASDEQCAQAQAAISLDDRAKCLEEGASRAQRAVKMLERRMEGHLDDLEDTKKSGADREKMSDVALKAKEAMVAMKASAEKATKLQQEIKEQKLKSGATQPKLDSDKVASEAKKLADILASQKQDSLIAETRVDQLIADLAKESNPQAQQKILLDLKDAGEDASKAKKLHEDTKSKLIATAGELTRPKAADLEKEIGEKAAKLYGESQKAVADANQAMLDIMALSPSTALAPPTRSQENDERLAFMKFLQSHPLLESEVSGSGIQISSTSGDGKVTVKPEFKWGRTASREFAVTVASPINKDGSDMSPAKNNVLLDKLAGDTTAKLEYTGLYAFDPNKYGNLFGLLGASGEIGYQEFSYLDPNTSFADPLKPEKVKEHNTSYALTVYAGFSPRDANDLYLLRFSRQYKRQGQAVIALCPPIATGAAYVTCPSGALGAPEGKKFNIMSAEWRHRFKRLAFSATLSYDRTSKVRAIAVPVFLPLLNRGFGALESGEPQFSAGLQFGWRSDTGGSVGVFAGLPFSLVSN